MDSFKRTSLGQNIILVFVLQLFLFQPIIDSIITDLNEEFKVSDLLEEGEEEQDSKENRTIEEELLHHKDKSINFGCYQIVETKKENDLVYIAPLYQSVNEEVNTPPPKID